jgi:hypothetical protein
VCIIEHQIQVEVKIPVGRLFVISKILFRVQYLYSSSALKFSVSTKPMILNVII